jgi:hypothetical protein
LCSFLSLLPAAPFVVRTERSPLDRPWATFRETRRFEHLWRKLRRYDHVLFKAIGSNADNKVRRFLPRGIFSAALFPKAALFQKGEALHTEFTDEGRGVTKRESPELFQHIIKPSPRALD